MRRIGGAILIALVGAALHATPAAAQDFRWTGALEEGQAVEIRGVNGDIQAGPAAGDRVEVTATKRAEDSDPESVEVEVVEHRGGVTICAVYPTPRGSAPNRCGPGDEARLNARDNDVKVDFTVRVPGRVDLRAETVNGSIEADGLSGGTTAETVNGSVSLSTSGVARAETVNGSIEARLGRADWDGELQFETVNGEITVVLPSGAHADVSAETVNGAIDTDFPLTVQGRWGPKEMRGTIGDGGRTLRMETVNGSIRLREG